MGFRKWSRKSCRKTKGMQQLLDKLCSGISRLSSLPVRLPYCTSGMTSGYSGARQCVKLSRQVSPFAKQRFKWQMFLHNLTANMVVTYYEPLLLARSRGSSVSTVTKLRTGQHGFRFSPQARHFPILQKDKIFPGPVNEYGGLLIPGVKAASSLSWSLTPPASVEVKNEYIYTYVLYICMAYIRT
jgi:hypothetical protein